MGKIRILIADDHPVFLEGLCQILEREPDFVVVGISTDGEETIRLAKQLRPDVTVVNVSTPKLGGIEVVGHIMADQPKSAVLMISSDHDNSYTLSSMWQGAVGCLLKSCCPRDLVDAVRMLHSDRSLSGMEAAIECPRSQVASAGEGVPGHHKLSPREIEILQLVATGASNDEISSRLGLSQRTVKAHLLHVFTKLDVRSRTQAVVHALKQGWLSLNDLPFR